jgi:hypothetical protein
VGLYKCGSRHLLRECGYPSALSMEAMDASETPLSKPTKIGEEVICQNLSELTTSSFSISASKRYAWLQNAAICASIEIKGSISRKMRMNQTNGTTIVFL